MKKQRTPQEKKKLSYENDSKNIYGENLKASRKNIPKHKRRVNKTYRCSVKQTIQKNFPFEIKNLPDIDSAVKEVKKEFWKKEPDITLGHFLEKKNDDTYYGTEISYYEIDRKRFYRDK